MPVDVPSVRLASPVDDAHPVATAPVAPGQFASEKVAVGFASGAKDCATVPFFTVISAKVAAPVTLNADGCVHLVGLLPAGVVQAILNLPVGAGSVTPLNMVAQLLALPAMLNVSFPLMLPRTTMPVLAMHGLPVLPSSALTTNVSVFAVPPLKSGGVKVMVPFHTPPAGLHVTLPGMFVPKLTALAALGATMTKSTEVKAPAARMRASRRAIRDPPFRTERPVDRVAPLEVCPTDIARNKRAQDAPRREADLGGLWCRSGAS